jgi:hypothetical protein
MKQYRPTVLTKNGGSIKPASYVIGILKYRMSGIT